MCMMYVVSENTFYKDFKIFENILSPFFWFLTIRERESKKTNKFTLLLFLFVLAKVFQFFYLEIILKFYNHRCDSYEFFSIFLLSDDNRALRFSFFSYSYMRINLINTVTHHDN